jgi:flavin reductase (DIM6/NTAB) family NADH-FMN oxidoreductase RutF
MFSWMPFDTMPHGGANAREYRAALGAFPTGVCLITTARADSKREGLTANSFASVSIDPPLVLWSLANHAASAEAFIRAQHYAIHILGADDGALALHFARPAADKFAAFAGRFATGLGGCPVLDSAAAVFECKAYSQHQGGDHTIFVGRVEAFQRNSVEPLGFLAGKLAPIKLVDPPANG